MNRREELRSKQEDEAIGRVRRRKLIVALGVVAVALAAILTAIFIGNGDKKITTPQTTVPAVTDNNSAIRAWKDAKVAADAPLVEIYGDYQCPACGHLENAWGPMFSDLAKDGKIRLQYTTMTFLDPANRTQNKNSSTRASMAASCASTVNYYEKYHAAVFANQPQTEGDGYSDDLLRVRIPQTVGMNAQDTEKFRSCYDTKATQQLVQDLNKSAYSNGVTGTPTIKINGKVFDLRQLSQKNTKELLLEVIKQNA